MPPKLVSFKNDNTIEQIFIESNLRRKITLIIILQTAFKLDWKIFELLKERLVSRKDFTITFH